MLVNLPKSIVCPTVGKELMRYSVIVDPNLGKPAVLVVMGDININTGDIAVKYFPLEGVEPFLTRFTDKIDRDGNMIMFIPKEAVNNLYRDYESFDKGTIIDYCKLVCELYNFCSEHTCSIGNYSSPITIDKNGDSAKINISEEAPTPVTE